MLMPSIFRENIFDDLMDDFMFPTIRRNTAETPQPMMRTDVKETENGYELSVDLPGYTKDDIKIQLKDGYMTIAAAKDETNETKDENGRFIRRERYTGSMKRSFYVGKNLTETDIKAKFENGILALDIPKVQPKVEEDKYIAIEG